MDPIYDKSGQKTKAAKKMTAEFVPRLYNAFQPAYYYDTDGDTPKTPAGFCPTRVHFGFQPEDTLTFSPKKSQEAWKESVRSLDPVNADWVCRAGNGECVVLMRYYCSHGMSYAGKQNVAVQKRKRADCQIWHRKLADSFAAIHGVVSFLTIAEIKAMRLLNKRLAYGGIHESLHLLYAEAELGFDTHKQELQHRDFGKGVVSLLSVYRRELLNGVSKSKFYVICHDMTIKEAVERAVLELRGAQDDENEEKEGDDQTEVGHDSA